MKRTLSFILALVLLLGLMPMGVVATEEHAHTYENGVCTGCGARIEVPVWEQGTIASVDGTNNTTNTRFRTADYHLLSDYSGVSINTGYTMTNFVYDENHTYLGTSSWIGSGIPFTTAELQKKYSTGVYFRVVFRADDQRKLTEEDITTSGVKFYLPGEEVPEPELGYSYEDVASIGTWQDGDIWDEKLFVLGAAGTGAVFDVKTGTKLGSLKLDGADVLKPHANSVCFGSTYFAVGDQYPLLYVNIYNNYASAADRLEGTCCVYRVTEKGGQFSTELVQVIKVGFTEDLTLWKSKENNGDVRPYGNFVVDRDKDMLYAFVMRDANKTTRFFGFDIPGVNEGTYNESYGCNVVTLNTEDIRTQFDSEHYKYLQGSCYSSGKILYMGDFGGDAPLYVVDLESQKVTDVFCLGYLGLRAEPEVICVDPEDGVLYYAAADGILRKLMLDAVHFHSYTPTVTAPTCTEQGYTTYTCACGDSYVGDYVAAEGAHDFTDWYTTKEAAYNADGEECRDCKKCSHVEFRSVKLEVISSGNVGKGTPYTDDVTYTLYADGTMVIAGNGTVYCSDWRGDYQPYKDYRTQVKVLIVEEGIVATSGGCFAHFYNLETVSLPDSLTKIDGNAFMSSFLQSITSVVIPKTVTYIGAYSYGFYYGKGGTTFTDIIIENPNVRFVDNKAVFNSGNNLENLTLYSYGANNNVSAYAEKYGCKYVDLDVYKTGIYSGVEYMYYDGVLTLSAAQTDATIAGEDAPWNAEKNNITKIVIESGITGISANAFKDYYHLESIEINNEIRHIGDGAFSTTETCDSALNLALPRTVKSVGSAIFAGRQNVTLTAYLGSAAAEINESGVTLHLKKQFKVLLIGNSYSEDASSCGQGMQDSQLLNILQAMLGEDAEVTVALLSSGGKGINWHATQAEQGNAAYSFKIISSNSPTWTTIGSASSYQALTWTDWDVVSLQPYNISASTGIEAVPYPDGTDMKFRDLKTASEFLLDYVGTHAPDADIYCYMHWSQTTGTTLNANLSHYNKFAAQYLGMMEHAGTTTGTKYTSLIPVGLSIQNARSTYLALLAYNIDASLNLTTDTQMGLQRDGGHLSFNVGRYIAGLTFAEMIVPQEWRADNYVLPDIRITESVGQLPKEYSIIAQKSVHAAVESWKNGSLAVTDIVGYTEDPTVAAGEALDSLSFALDCDTAEGLATQLNAAVLAALPADFAVDAVALDELQQTAAVTIRFGYTSLVVEVDYFVATHSYTPTVTAPTCTEQGYTTYTCSACGDSYVEDYVAATGHSYENGICAVCGAVKPMESVDSVDALVTALRQAMVQRQKQIQLRLNDIVLASAEVSNLVTSAMAHTGTPYEGDYIRANMVGYSWALTTGSDDTGVYSIVTVTCNFISDAQMEAEMDAAVAALLNELNLWNASNYEKVKGVYDWITENVSYDYDWDDLEDDTNYYKHTTYAALIDKNAVCQGIASLYYRLMLELGVDCRYISGISTDITGTEGHAWNIVYLDGKYYNCDPTWDLGLTGYYRYFLCTKGNFSGHTRDAEFDTTQFHTDYPMAVTPYVLNVAASGTVNSKISWVLDGDTGTLTVAGTGAIPSYRSSRAPWYDYRESVRKIVISEGITEVGERAFYWCTNCTQVDLPNSLVAIREYGFNNLRSLKNITLPSKLKTIEFCAFSECVALTSITLPDSVTTVGSNAFSNCYELTSAVLSGGMKTIPSSMFGGDSKLKTVVLPEGVTYIDDTAFINCGFYSFTLPASVTGLGTSVFSGCTSLSKFIVEEGNSAYKAVDGVLFSADGTHLICYPSAKTGNYTVPEGTKYIDYGAFRSQRYMYYVYFPSTLIKIDGYAFSYCKYLTGVTFNSNITTIGDSAFRSCTNLKSVTFANPNVTLVGYTFADCTALRTITLPSKLKEIPNGLFSGCTNLQSITIPSTVTKIGSSAFIDCDSLTTITVPGTVKSIGQQAFDFCNKLETIVFEEGVTTLGWLCIRNAPKLKKVVIPSSVTTIDQPSNTTSYTFDDCPNMVLYVTCGSYIHSYAVRKGLSHQVSHTVKAVITAPTCTKQGYTTYTCTACGDSYVADYTAALGHTAGADADCTNPQVCTVCGVVLNAALGHSYNSVVTAPTCTEQGYTTYTCIFCSDSYVGDYVAAEGAHDFTDWYTIKDATYDADGEECRDCKKCSHVEFRSVKLEVITSGNVGYNTDVVTYTLYADGTMVVSGRGRVYCSDWRGNNQPYYAYRDQVKRLIIEEGITQTMGGCFAYFVNLESVSFPDSLTHINKNAFMNSFVSSLETITIPETVTYLADYAFGFYSGAGSAVFTDVIIENPNVSFHASNAVFNSGKNLQNLTLYSYGAENNVRTYAEKYGIRYVDLNDYQKGEFGDVYYEVSGGVLRLEALVDNATVSAADQPWASFRDKITKIVICEGVASMDSYAFADYTALEIVILPDNFKSIGNGAFAVTASTDVVLALTIPKHIESLGKNLFSGRGQVDVCGYYNSLAEQLTDTNVNLTLKKVYKLLFIGNSYSEDASNGSHTTDSQMFTILQAMLGEDAEITVALLSSGGKGMHWHATQAEQNNAAYSFKVISTDNPKWKSMGSYTSANALAWTDWDAVSLQPYNINVSTGQESVPYPDTTDPKFYHIADSSAYMLDHTARYAPYAAIYFYMHWAQTSSTVLNAALSSYNKAAAFMPQVLDYVGTETGAQFKTIVPVGLSIQNARTTYLALLRYNTTAYADGNLNLNTDAQIGLQRDGGHVSFNIGRYIAALTFAEMLIPAEMRADHYVLLDIRITESVGQLPKEYSIIAQKSVHAAVESWKNGSLAVTDIVGYTEDPTVAAGEALEGLSFALNCDTAEGLAAQLNAAVLAALPADFAVDAVALDEVQQTAAVTIRFGYTSLVVAVDYFVATHSCSGVVTAPDCVNGGFTTYTCSVCGDSYVADYTDALGHTPGADADCENAQVCTVCGTVLNPALGHSYDSVVTAPDCVNGGHTTYTCTACGDSYVADYTDALGHTAGADADCTNPQVCTVCGVVLNAALGHNYDSVVTAPDCVNGGYTTYTCTACGDSYVADYTDALGHTAGTAADCTNPQVCTVCGVVLNAALGHSYDAFVTAPDCVNGGYTTYTCTACGDSYVADYTDALGHTAGADADCTNPQVCTVCGVVLNAALGHSYDAFVTVPDCVNGGYTTYTCSACGDSYVADHTDATDHVYDHDNDTTCNGCGAVRQIAAQILGGGETSVSEDVNGLAFLFIADVSGAQTENGCEYVANSALVTPFVDGASYKLVRMGAVVSNGVQTIDIPAKYLWDVAAEQCSFAVRIINIPDNQLDCVITARPYYVYEVDGEEIVVYGDAVSATYNQAAQ